MISRLSRVSPEGHCLNYVILSLTDLMSFLILRIKISIGAGTEPWTPQNDGGYLWRWSGPLEPHGSLAD